LLDSQVLLSHILGRNRGWILAHPEVQLTAEQEMKLNHAVRRLQCGEPLPYVLGHWEFYGLDFYLTSDVLIPRPETEILVEQALAYLWSHPGRRRVADIGTGSGCIAVSLAKHIPDLWVLASDISLDALLVARRNAKLHQVSQQIHFVCADLVSPLCNARELDLICANLPYIPSRRLKRLAVSHWEPALALNGGPRGLRFLYSLMHAASEHVTPATALMLEIDCTQAEEICRLAHKLLPEHQPRIIPDLAGRPRLLVLQSPGS
jgi:release factor glutamine methyltransferase